MKSAGEAIEKGGMKLETSAADSVKKNVGETAGKAVEVIGKGVEGAGKGVEGAGDKMKDAVKKP